MDDVVHVGAAHPGLERLAGGAADQVLGDRFRALELALVLELQLAGDRGQRGVDVGDAGDHRLFLRGDGAPLGIGHDVFQYADREALGNARTAVHPLVLARLEGHALDQLGDEVGQLDRPPAALEPGFLARDRRAQFHRVGVVGDDLRSDAVLERRDDLAAGRVVLGVGREDQCHVQVQADRIAFHLDVSLLHDVEEAHLDLAGEIGELVDRKNAAVCPRQEPEVHGQLIRQQMAAARSLDGVHVADDVRDRDIGRGELLHEAGLARQPGDGGLRAVLRHELASELRDRRERIVVHLAPREDRNLLVEQRDQLAQDAALRLPPQAQQDEVVARQDGIHELGDDGILVAHDAREQGRPVLEQTDQILAQLVLDGAVDAGGTRPLGLLQLSQRGRLGHRAIVNRLPPAV